MNDSQSTQKTVATPPVPDDLPQGDHPLEVAARRGIGPLGPVGQSVWHGNARPCVSCGQLVTRDAERCYACDQDLSEGMLRKMRAHAGPWYVFDHVRPFPGVSLDRIVRQIRRGVLTETSIVRGPATNYQWRFAAETPGLCRYFGWCWRCHEKVTPSDVHCRSCRSPLAFETGQTPPKGPVWTEPAPAGALLPPPASPRGQLRELTAALRSGNLPSHEAAWEAPPRLGRLPVAWITAVLLLIVIVALIGFSRIRLRETASSTRPPHPDMQPAGDVINPTHGQSAMERPGAADSPGTIDEPSAPIAPPSGTAAVTIE